VLLNGISFILLAAVYQRKTPINSAEINTILRIHQWRCHNYLLALFEQNKHNLEETQYRPETEPSPEPSGNSTENKHSFFEYNPYYDYSSYPAAILFIKSDLRLVVDLQNNLKACQSRAYAQKVKISNLQQMAKTIAYVQEHHYDTMESL